MLILDSTLKSIELILSGAVTTNQLPFVISYIDVTSTTYVPNSNDGISNNAIAVTAISAPIASTQRQIKLIIVHNADTVAATVTLRLNNNGTSRTICKVVLSTLSQLIYTDGEGFRVIDANGGVVQGNNIISLTSQVSGILPVANGGTGVSALSDVLGTSNQVTVTGGTARVIGGNVTLALPQNIHTGATPQFTRLGLGAAVDTTAQLNLNSFLFYSDGTRLSLGGASINTNRYIDLQGTFTGITNTLCFSIQNTINGVANGLIYGVYINPTLVEASSGTHVETGTVHIEPVFTNGTAISTDVFGLQIKGFTAPTGTPTASALKLGAPTGATTNYALNVAAGTSYFSGIVIHNSTTRLKNYTVGTLPTGVQGDLAYCTDLLTPTFLANATGGGAVVGVVFYDGTNWKTI